MKKSEHLYVVGWSHRGIPCKTIYGNRGSGECGWTDLLTKEEARKEVETLGKGKMPRTIYRLVRVETIDKAKK